jgi:hypothetical protein
MNGDPRSLAAEYLLAAPAVLLDFNGTLSLDEDLLEDCYAQALHALDLAPLSPGEYADLLGRSEEDIAAVLLAHRGTPLSADALLDEVAAAYVTACRERPRVPAAHLELVRALRTRGIPLAIVDPAGDPPADVPSIGSANWTGGLVATRHLIELGHRRIAAITGPDDMMCSLARIDGYRSAMNAAGLPIDPAWVRYGDFHTTGGETHTRELLALPEPPTAIFAGSDLQALGALAAATQAIQAEVQARAANQARIAQAA